MTTQPQIRLLVVDDHPVVRSGIIGMLSGEPDLEVVGQAGNGREALQVLAHATADLQPQVVLMDLRMPVMDGVTTIEQMHAEMPDPPHVVVLTTYDTDGDILRAIEAGATSYLLKDAPREEVLAAVRAAATGQSMLSPSVATRLVQVRHNSVVPSAAETTPSLSPREKEVLQAVAQGLSNQEIGAQLYITEATVKTHLLRIFNKLGVDSRTLAVTSALRHGLLDLD